MISRWHEYNYTYLKEIANKINKAKPELHFKLKKKENEVK